MFVAFFGNWSVYAHKTVAVDHHLHSSNATASETLCLSISSKRVVRTERVLVKNHLKLLNILRHDFGQKFKPCINIWEPTNPYLWFTKLTNRLIIFKLRLKLSFRIAKIGRQISNFGNFTYNVSTMIYSDWRCQVSFGSQSRGLRRRQTWPLGAAKYFFIWCLLTFNRGCQNWKNSIRFRIFVTNDVIYNPD